MSRLWSVAAFVPAWVLLYGWLSDGFSGMWGATAAAGVIAFGSGFAVYALRNRGADGRHHRTSRWARLRYGALVVAAGAAAVGFVGHGLWSMATARPVTVHVESCRETLNSASNPMTACSGTWPGGRGRVAGVGRSAVGHDVAGWATGSSAATDRGEWLPVPFGLVAGAVGGLALGRRAASARPGTADRQRSREE